MGLLSGILGHASETDVSDIERDLQDMLVEGEKVKLAYKLVRDLIVLTDKRFVLIDKQGVTGKKQEILSIPYGSISQFSKEGAGRFDMDSDLKIWVRGQAEPLRFDFKRGGSINDVYRILSEGVLK